MIMADLSVTVHGKTSKWTVTTENENIQPIDVINSVKSLIDGNVSNTQTDSKDLPIKATST